MYPYIETYIWVPIFRDKASICSEISLYIDTNSSTTLQNITCYMRKTIGKVPNEIQ
jgi:hypothetical protein